jgi:hypothetical protein
MIVKRYESGVNKGERIPMDFSGIKSLIKNKLSSDSSRKWL